MALRGVLPRAVATAAAVCTLGVSSAAPAGAAPGVSAPEPPAGSVVLVGVPGLMWEEAGPETTPHLWELAGESAIGNMSIRAVTSRTCPVDGWLTVSAGQRAFSERQQHFICELPVPPAPRGEGAVVPDFADHVEANADSPYAARAGLLGQAVHDTGGSTLAVGAGAALAAADTDGRVDRYLDGVGELRTRDLDAARLAVVELDDLADLYLEPPENPDATTEDEEPDEEEPEPDPIKDTDRIDRLAAIDDQLGDVLRVLPEDSVLMVAGVSVEAGPSNLNAVLLRGPGPGGDHYDGGYLTSESTRHDGLVALTDVSTTLLHASSIETQPGMVGRAATQAERPADTGTAVEDLVKFNTAAKVVESHTPGFFSGLVTVQLLIYAAAAYALHRYGERNRRKRGHVLSLTRVVALGGAAFPVSSYLANLVPWWSAGVPQLALPATVLIADTLVVALAMAGPWRRTILGPMTVVAGVTTAVLFVDMCTGANLQMNSPTGYTPIVAGRFYGLGNIAFATFATGILMTVAGLAHPLLVRGRRTSAVVMALVIGVSGLFVIGWPNLGTDFGGVLGLIPGLAVTVLMLADRRVTVTRMVAVIGAAFAVIALMSYLDHLRPANERTHFGYFVGEVVGGEAVTLVSRKLSGMLGTLGNWQLTLLSACALLFLFAVLNKPTNWRVGTLQRAYEYAPTLRAGLTGSLVTAVAGFAFNDSGIAIPALALTVAVPLTLSACTWVLQREGPEPVTSPPPDCPAPVDGPAKGAPADTTRS